MNNLRQTTLPFRPTSSSRLKADAHSSSPSNTSKGSTPKDTSSSHSSHSAPVSDERERLRQLAKDTLSTLRRGVYISPSGKSVHIKPVVEACLKGTLFYPPDAWNNWENTVRTGTPYATRFSIREVTTLESAQSLVIESRKITPTGDSNTSSSKPPSVGILNFASATKPGGGFKNGAIAQEESIARVSSLYFSLTTPTGLQFYKKDVRESEGAAYSHAMIYSPRVIVFNNDGNTFLEEPYEVSVVTSPAVNAGTVRQRNQDKDPAKVERAIARIMTERMARILALFENRGDRWIVLGSYGTGVFRNSVETVAEIWARLLLKEDSRFAGVFERVEFAIVGQDTFQRFSSVFKALDSARQAARNDTMNVD